jgi:transposase InsO family protein
MKFKFISDHRETFKVGLMCEVLKVSRPGFYAWLRRPESLRSRENRKLEDKIRVIHKDNKEIYGSPRIHAELKDQGAKCSKNRVARIMRGAGIRSRIKRKFKATTDSRHNFPVAPNLLDQNFEVNKPNEVWAADITYIHTNEGWLYLAAVMDLFSRKIIGWAMARHISRRLTLGALEMAITNRSDIKGVIHHSDRGSQYASSDYQELLKEHDIICSMSRKGNCYDNAVMESFFHSLKTEWVHRHRYLTRQQAKDSIFYYIEIYYNRKRRHSFLNHMNPHEYEVWKMAA